MLYRYFKLCKAVHRKITIFVKINYKCNRFCNSFIYQPGLGMQWMLITSNTFNLTMWSDKNTCTHNLFISGKYFIVYIILWIIFTKARTILIYLRAIIFQGWYLCHRPTMELITEPVPFPPRGKLHQPWKICHPSKHDPTLQWKELLE